MFKIFAAIITLILFILFLVLTVMSALLQQWMGAITCLMVACGFGYFVYVDYLTYFTKNK